MVFGGLSPPPYSFINKLNLCKKEISTLKSENFSNRDKFLDSGEDNSSFEIESHTIKT